MEMEQGQATHRGFAGDISHWVWLGAPSGVPPRKSLQAAWRQDPRPPCAHRWVPGPLPARPGRPLEVAMSQVQPGQLMGVPQQGADPSPGTSSAHLLLTGWD